jgi:hypothetical protein
MLALTTDTLRDAESAHKRRGKKRSIRASLAVPYYWLTHKVYHT